MTSTRDAYASESILAEGHTISNNTWESKLNCNQLVLGPSGSGKTRNFLKPNLLQMNASYIVLDTKGQLYEEVGPVLAEAGYRVEKLNFADVSGTIGYDPLRHVRVDPETGRPSQRDILSAASALCPMLDMKDPFWDMAAADYIASYMAYILEANVTRNKSMSEVIRLFEGIIANKNKFEDHLQALAYTHPDSYANALYTRHSQNATAEKMHASILGFVATKLNTLGFDEAMAMFSNEKQVDFPSMGHEKTALFVTVSDVDFSLTPLTNLFLTHAFQELIEEADKCPGGRLPVPVRIFLDDFYNVHIPNFDKIIAVTRSREIWCTILCQTVAQLQQKYGVELADTVMGNCDVHLVLAFQDAATAKYYTHFADKPLRTLLTTPLDDSWLFIRGRRGIQVKKYDVDKHPALVAWRERHATGQADNQADKQAATEAESE